MSPDGNPEICQVTKYDIQKYFVYLQDNNRSPHYIHANYRALRTFFNWCVAEEFIDKSPLNNLKAPKLPRQGKPFLTQEQYEKLLSVCARSTFTGIRNYAVLRLLWGSGMRLSELSNLKLDDLNWEKGHIRVFGKGSRERYAPFPLKARKAVYSYILRRRDDLPELWLTESRHPAKKWCIVSAMVRMQERAGLHGEIQDMHHIFRRSWAHRMIQERVPLKYIQLAGGWSNLSVLMQYVAAIESEEALNTILEIEDRADRNYRRR